MNSDRKNSSWLSIQFAAMLLISLIILKLNLINYGAHQFGLWILLASIWGFGSALDFGFGTSLVKYVAEYNKFEKENTNKLLSTSFFIFIIAGVLIFVLGNVVAGLFYFSDPKIIRANEIILFRKIFFILGLSFIVQYMMLFYKSTLEGLNNFVLTSKINMLNNIYILVGVLVVTLCKFSIIYLSLVYLSANLITYLTYLFVFRFNYPQFEVSINNFSLEHIKKIFRFSISMQLISIFSAMIDPAIKYIIGSFYQVNYVSSYEIARRFAIAISGLFFSAFKIILPKTSILRNPVDYRSFIMGEGLKYSRIGLTYSGVVFGIFTFLIVLVIKLWFHSDESVIIFLLLALPESINNVGFTIYMFLIGIGKAHIISLVQLFNVTVISTTLIIGFTLFNNIFGILGYFITVLIVNIFMIIYTKKIVKISVSSFLLYIGIYKLILLLIVILSSALLIQSDLASVYFILGAQSILSILLFGKDIKQYFTLFLNYVMGKNV